MKIIFFLLTWIFRFIGFVSYSIGSGSRVLIGKQAGNILKFLSRSRWELTIKNLSSAFKNNSKSEIKIIANKCYQNLGITFLELLAMGRMTDQEISSRIKYKNPESLKELYSKGRGLILLSGHYGNWEYLAYTAGLHLEYPILIVVKNQKNKYADSLLNSFRTKGGNRTVSMYHAARDLVKELKNGGAVAMLADQSASWDKDIYVDFFGKPAATFEAPAALALKFNVPVIMGFSIRRNDGTYYVELNELKHDDLEDNKAGIEELTKRHVRELEKLIREHPEQWVWQHNRWKHAPQ